MTAGDWAALVGVLFMVVIAAVLAVAVSRKLDRARWCIPPSRALPDSESAWYAHLAAAAPGAAS